MSGKQGGSVSSFGVGGAVGGGIREVKFLGGTIGLAGSAGAV
jgi:propanediol dehydratase large subunit